MVENVLQPGDVIILLPGNYSNPTYGTRDIWKAEQTIRLNRWVGTAAAYITIKAQSPGAAILRGDGTAIFQLRNSEYIRIQDLVILGEVERIPLEEAKAHQFMYKDNNGVIKYRVNPNLTDHEIGDINNLPKPISATRPSLFNTDGLLLQSSHHIEVTGCTVGYMPATGINAVSCDYITMRGNVVHDCSRRSSAGNHGVVFHTLTSTNDGFSGYRFVIEQNIFRDNYNEVKLLFIQIRCCMQCPTSTVYTLPGKGLPASCTVYWYN
jgi:hypothetical protein